MNMRTVKDLYAYLRKIEENWTDEDRHFLGEFQHQQINVPYFSLNRESKFQGYGPGEIHFDGGLGFIIQQSSDDRE